MIRCMKHQEEVTTFQPILDGIIKEREVQDALALMKRGKSWPRSSTPVDTAHFWKLLVPHTMDRKLPETDTCTPHNGPQMT